MHESRNTVLIVDNDPKTQRMLKIFLSMENFKIIETTSGKQALRLSVSIKPNLILCDINLPDMDGIKMIMTIREWSQIPIIALSAYTSDEEMARTLNMGANDFVLKPFNMEVLIARINASLRTFAVHEAGEPELLNGPLRIDLLRHEVFLDDQHISFTPKEYELLRYFMINQGKMLTHKEILKKIWGEAHGEDTTYLRVYIGQIREKIGQHAADPSMIITLPGIGYRMEILSPSTFCALSHHYPVYSTHH